MKQLIGFLIILLLFFGLRSTGVIECSAATFNFQSIKTTIFQEFQSSQTGIQKLAEKNLSKTYETGSFEWMPEDDHNIIPLLKEEDAFSFYVELDQKILANSLGSQHEICLYIDDFEINVENSLLLRNDIQVKINSYIDISPLTNGQNFNSFTRSSTFESNISITGPATRRFVKQVILEMYIDQIIDLLKYHINSPKNWSKTQSNS